MYCSTFPGRVAAALRRHWFLLGVVLALIAGFAAPEPGRVMNPGGAGANLLIAGLFVLVGLSLPTERIIRDIGSIRLHLYVQLFLFIGTPLFYVAVTLPFRTVFHDAMLVGILALSCLPTTISSCVVFTGSSGGNTVGALFNSALSNLMGVLISPLLLSLLISGAGYAVPADRLLAILRNLGIMMLLPLVAGQVVRIGAASFVDARRAVIGTVSNVLILCIVYFAFAATSNNPIFRSGIGPFIGPLALVAVGQVVLTAGAFFGAGLFGLRREDRIAALFTASQKTMAMGTPLLTAYFVTRPDVLGVALIPLVFYHSWQLFTAGMVRALFFQRIAMP